ncbi:MAG: alpha/beta hydrolase [Flavobacterium sp.]|nr:MAG: alpha/beta hydrolase [Flavobacterium sp.]
MKKWTLMVLVSITALQVKSQVSTVNVKQERFQKIQKQFAYKDSVIYKTINGEALMLTIYFPTVKKYEKAPIMLYTHGGGWASGDRFNVLQLNFVETLKILTANGIACASVEYRLTRLGISNAFDCVVDCKDAGRFLVKNAAKYGIDPSRIGVWGGSAGGHLCLMTALGNPKDFPGDNTLKNFDPIYKCVSSYFPLTTFLKPDVLEGSNFSNPNRFIAMFGGLLKDKMALAKLLSPTEYVSKETIPILLLHGDNDKVLNIKQSLYMMEVAKEKKANVEMLTVKGAGHGFQGENIQPGMLEINKISAAFIIKHI